MRVFIFFFFFFNDTATTEIYTLSLHDALPISGRQYGDGFRAGDDRAAATKCARREFAAGSLRWKCERLLHGERRSEEHTSELQSRPHLVCRLLLEKKKKNGTDITSPYERLKTI